MKNRVTANLNAITKDDLIAAGKLDITFVVKFAFIAGFAQSGEGFNGEHGATDDEVDELSEKFIKGLEVEI